MKMAEFLNLETKQVQWLDASLEHPNLVKVPEGAVALVLYDDDAGYWFDKGNLTKGFGRVSFLANFESDSKSDYSLYEYVKHCRGELVWQRNPLQEKINETLSALNISKAQLSILLGREKSYVKRLLAKNRNVTEKTKVTVIDRLDQLIRVHEKDQGPENSKCIKKLTVTLSVDTKEVQDELKKAYNLIDQANDNSIAWLKKYKDQKNISLFLISIISASIVFLVLYCLWGVV